MNNDAAGFLFDMMSTHILHKTPVAERKYHKYSQCLSLIAGKRLCVCGRDCGHVDGACDEGPSHDEIQFIGQNTTILGEV